MTHGEWFFLSTIIYLSLAPVSHIDSVTAIGRVILAGTMMFNGALFLIDIAKG